MKLIKCNININPEPPFKDRISLMKYFFSIARLAAARSPCPLGKRHGAVLTNKGYIISVGYNGPASGITHCEKCLLEIEKEKSNIKSWDICPAIHAEENSILTAAKFGMNIDGLIMYTTKRPCEKCISRMINSGIKEVYFL